MHPWNSESYCEFRSCFFHQRGQDLLLAHLLHQVGIVRHHDRHLFHHLAWICSLRSCWRWHKPKQPQPLPVKSSNFQTAEVQVVALWHPAGILSGSGSSARCVLLVFSFQWCRREVRPTRVCVCVLTNRKCQDKVQVVQTQGNAVYSPKVNTRERYPSRWGLTTLKHLTRAVRASSIQCQVKEWASQVNGQ